MSAESPVSVVGGGSQPLAYAWGGPVGRGVTRQVPEDFLVQEVLAFEPAQSGQHVLLFIQKREANTTWLAAKLARVAGVPSAAVGYAGRKDRHAVTEQWFSVDLAGRPAPDWHAALSTETEGCAQVLQVFQHNRKLRVGALRGNRFNLRIRDLAADGIALQRRLEMISKEGFPNYFGPQRFGRDGSNLQQARALTAQSRRPRRAGRGERTMALSAARSEIFNAVLDARVRSGSWNQSQAGDILQLAGRGSHFLFDSEQDGEALARRTAAGELNVTGPMWGAGEPPTDGAVKELERAMAADYPELCALLAGEGMAHQRRALRVYPSDLKWQIVDSDEMNVSFFLPAGAYATSLLRELLDTGEPTLERGEAKGL